MELGNTLIFMRKYQEAESHYERSILLTPDEHHTYYLKARLYLVWKGSTIEARKALERASKYINLVDYWRIVDLEFELDVLDRKYEEALARLPLDSLSADDLTLSDTLWYARIHGYRGDKTLADRYYEQAIEKAESKLAQNPDHAYSHSALGIAHAGLGHGEIAVEEGKLGLKLQEAKKAGTKFYATKDLAEIYTMVGQYNNAIDQIEDLLSFPQNMSIPFLQLDPAWDPLRNHPRFQELLESAE
jgi:serine/threonine-protein kinase